MPLGRTGARPHAQPHGTRSARFKAEPPATERPELGALHGEDAASRSPEPKVAQHHAAAFGHQRVEGVQDQGDGTSTNRSRSAGAPPCPARAHGTYRRTSPSGSCSCPRGVATRAIISSTSATAADVPTDPFARRLAVWGVVSGIPSKLSYSQRCRPAPRSRASTAAQPPLYVPHSTNAPSPLQRQATGNPQEPTPQRTLAASSRADRARRAVRHPMPAYPAPSTGTQPRPVRTGGRRLPWSNARRATRCSWSDSSPDTDRARRSGSQRRRQDPRSREGEFGLVGLQRIRPRPSGCRR